MYTEQLATTRCTTTMPRGAASHETYEIKQEIWSCFSVTKFGSATAQILLESGSSAKERFRFDLK